MATLYSSIYDVALSKITDYTFLNLTQVEIEDILEKYLKSAIVKFKFCKKDLTNRDEINKQFNETLTDEEIEILATLLTIEWLNPQILSLEKLKQNFSSREFSLFSSANTLRELLNLRNELKKEANDLIAFYYYTN